MAFSVQKVVFFSSISFGTVLFHVLFQAIIHFAGIVALLTGKGFLSGVRKHVILQTTGASGREATLLTFKGLFSSVFQLVGLEMVRMSA